MIQQIKKWSRLHSIYFLYLALLLTACKTSSHYQLSGVSYQQAPVKKTTSANNPLEQMLKPYADSINKTMNRVLGLNAQILEKRKPESTLGNLVADASLIMAQQKLDPNTECAFVNYGGIRINNIQPGPITLGKVYELMPFDNVLVVISISGTQLQTLCDKIAAADGWPTSGLSFNISNGKATNVVIGTRPIDEMATYKIALSDYLANGGDDLTMFKNLPQTNKNYLVRQAIIDYIQAECKNNAMLQVNITQRITKQ
jgi:2',3'-cyclic-nucleotide 2'-phosphodiesterase (5'-nucleotidase family)